MHFDSAFHATSSDGLMFYGSAVDHRVTALDAKTGETRWDFFAEGPVRTAPSVWRDRILFGSDDGYVYCLYAADGRLVWKYRAGPAADKVIGNGQMISLWPVRSDILVEDEAAYFAAGVFPYEGITICALNPADGSVIWKNDTTGDHAFELQYGGISPQGYLLASSEHLYVPSGRAMPAAFDKINGALQYYLSPGGKVGGTWALLTEGELIAGVDRSSVPAKVAYDEKTGKSKGDAYAWFPGNDLVITPTHTYSLTDQGVFAIDRRAYASYSDQINRITGAKQKLSTLLLDLRRKAIAVTGDDKKILQQQVDETTQKLNDLALEEKNLKGQTLHWFYPKKDLTTLVLAGDTIVAGGKGFAVALDGQTGKETWTTLFAGKAMGLTVSDGRLIISTDLGTLYAFGTSSTQRPAVHEMTENPSPYPAGAMDEMYDEVAKRVLQDYLKEKGSTKGYCLVLGAGEGRLAYELARRSELQIIGLESNKNKAAEAKKRLQAAGLYGSRVLVETWDLYDLPDYFANLVVSEEILFQGITDESPQEMYRVLAPYGGIAWLGQSADRSAAAGQKALLQWVQRSGAPASEITLIEQDGYWFKMKRGPLAGAGQWTSLYGNPQNTSSSDDQWVKTPLGVLWFGEPGSEEMVDRHARAAGPIAFDGKLFVQGEEVLMAYDAYNGTKLWERKIDGAVRVRVDVDGGNLSVGSNGLYAAINDKVHRLDLTSGHTLNEFDLPAYEVPASPDGTARRWGYVMNVGDTLLGTTAMPQKSPYAALWTTMVQDGKWVNLNELPADFQPYAPVLTSFLERFPEPNEDAWNAFQQAGLFWRLMDQFPKWGSERDPSASLEQRMQYGDSIFALDALTGRPKWVYRGKEITNISPTLGDGVLFFTDNNATEAQKQQAWTDRQEAIRHGVYEPGEEANLTPAQMDVRIVVAMDMQSGEVRWQRPVDFTGCGGYRLGSAYHKDGYLVFFGHFSNHDRAMFDQNQLMWRRITTLNAASGDIIWSRPLNYLRRPLIVGDNLIVEPRACDVATGKIKMREHPITGEIVPWEFYRPGHSCSVTSAAADCIFYRSYNNAFYDLVEDRGMSYFGGIRTGCWLNFVPANGVLMIPESSSGCTCSFPLRCTVVLKHKAEERRPRDWTVFITHGPMTPVQRFAVNFGAPGDMKDNEGRMWFGYPRPKVAYTVKFDLNETIPSGPGFYTHDFKGKTIEGTDAPWLFTSGCVGLRKFELPLIDETWGEK
ncbi:MAG: hypothetical protein A3G75_06395, partial [Verrucomicrobia bacterium RIFCSPLOWO2_12_FULL_64_8]